MKTSGNPGSLEGLGGSVLLPDVPGRGGGGSFKAGDQEQKQEQVQEQEQEQEQEPHMSPGISFSAREIVFLPQSAREMSATL